MSGRSCGSIKLAVASNMALIKHALYGRDVSFIPLPYPIMTWWHKHLSLQPYCDFEKSHEDDAMIIAALHRSLRNPADILDDLQQGVGDAYITIVRTLDNNQSKPTILIDGMDMSMLMALWNMHRHADRKDIIITTSILPSFGVSMTSFKRHIVDQYALLEMVQWENFLFCLPMLIDAGVPPLLMLQCDGRISSLQLLSEAVQQTHHRILCDDADGNTAIDLLPLIIIVSNLAKREATIIKDNSSDRNEVYAPSSLGWEKFKPYYYRQDGPSIQRIVRVYIAALIQISDVGNGKCTDQHTSSDIMLEEAPLAEDIYDTMDQQLRNHIKYIRLPSGHDYGACGSQSRSAGSDTSQMQAAGDSIFQMRSAGHTEPSAPTMRQHTNQSIVACDMRNARMKRDMLRRWPIYLQMMP